MSKHALVAVAALIATATFPTTVRLWNNSWRDAVEPETLTVVPAYGHADVVFTSADQLKRANSNVETHNLVNQWVAPAGLFFVEPAETVAAVETDPAPAPVVDEAPAPVEPAVQETPDLAASTAASAAKPGGKSSKK